MSASPSLPNGQGATPTGKPPILLRKKRPVDPLVARKKPLPKQAATKPKPAPRPGANGFIDLGAKDPRDELMSSVSEKDLREFQAQKAKNGGWTDPAPAPNLYQDFPVFATRGSVLRDVHHHIMRFTRPDRPVDHQGGGKADDFNIDPTDQDMWPRPVTLGRRDPRAVTAVKEVKGETPAENTVDEAEAERLAQIKADKEAQRAIDLAQIAPVIKENNSKPKPKRKEENTVTRFQKDSAEWKKQSQLRYQEAYPWILEDAEGKNGWVGRREAPLSEMNVALIVSGSGFRMVPLEGYYRFTARQKYKGFSLQEAENQMKQRTQPLRWILTESEEKKKQDKEYAEYREFMGGRVKVKTESATSRAAPKSERNEDWEIDMEGDEFQDDDENPGFDADDEVERDAKGRVRREQLGANIFGDADENEVDKEEKEERGDKERRKLQGKDMKKALKKREKAFVYESDSSDAENNPFSESSSEDSDEEEEGKEKEDKEKEKEKEKGKSDQKDKPASGASSKGNNTPSAKPKPAEVLKKGKKRPGSPSLSESSGNESSRKKGVKKAKTGATSSVTASRSTTPMPGGVRKTAAGAASDGEATAGEMSDGGRKKKIKLVGTGTGTGAKGTPVGSRAGSPAPSAASGFKGPSPAKSSIGKPGSPPGSPPPSRPRGATGPVEASEVEQVLAEHPKGISLAHLFRPFAHRVGEKPGQMARKDWIKIVGACAAYGADKLLRLRTTASAAALAPAAAAAAEAAAPTEASPTKAD